MNIVEIQLIIEQHDGLANALDANAILPDDIDDPLLADKISDAIDLLQDIEEYINDKIEDMRDDDCDNNC